jgi:membrane protease YdiL (CAAX protease family)
VVPPHPYTLDTLARLAGGVALCLLVGAALAGATHYDPATATLAAPWFYGLGLAGAGTLAGALVLVLREWTVEGFGRRVAVVCVLVFTGLNLTVVASRSGGNSGEELPGMAAVVISTLALQGASLGLVAWFLRRNQMRWQDAFGFPRAPRRAVLLGVVLGVLSLPLLWLLQAACGQLLTRLGWEPSPQTMIQIFLESAGPAGKIYLALVAMLMAPLAEEILFRGILYAALKHRFRLGVALGVSALVFAGLHANAASFLPLAAFAVALARLYDHTQNLLAPITAHAVFNAGNVIFLVFYERFLPAAP